MNPMSPRRSSLTVALVLALLLPLLAACAQSGASQVPLATPAREANKTVATAPVAATAAPAAVASYADSPAATAAPATDAVAPASEAAGMAAAPVPSDAARQEPGRNVGQAVPLKAGEVNDNATFQDYLNYLRSYQGARVRPIDVSERTVITVRDDEQRPVLDARVRIYDGRTQVFEGRTYAGGKTLFLPRAFDYAPGATSFRVVAEQGNSVVESSLSRGQGELALTLRGSQPPSELRLDVLFLLDTTGSMGDELARIQNTIDSIAQRIDAFQPRPVLRFGLVAYRDEGDEYVTRAYDFTSDVTAFRDTLNGLAASGGGDTPEALDEALYQAMHRVQWAEGAVRLAFLVADAGPHTNNAQQYTYVNGIRDAVAAGVKIYPIAASNTDDQAEYVFRQLAQQTLAGFIFLTYQPGQNSGTPGESTTLEAGQNQQYTVDRLDDLIVQVVERELAEAVGAF